MNTLKKIVLMVVALAAWPAAAQYESVRMVQQLGELPQREVMFSAFGYAKVKVVQDSSNYVVFNLFRIEDTASLPDGLMYVEDSDNDLLRCVRIMVSDFPTVLSVEVHLKTRSLLIDAVDYSTIRLSSANGRDSLVYDNLFLNAQGHGTVEVTNHINAGSIRLYAGQLGMVGCSSYSSPKYSEERVNQGVIRVGARNGKFLSWDKDDWHTFGNAGLAIRRYKPIDRIHISLLGAFHNWGTSSLNGLSGTEYIFDYNTGYYWERNAKEDASSVRTALGSVQLELTYDIVAREHFAIGLGLGFEHDVYRFRHPFVSYVEGEDISVTTQRMSTTLDDYHGFTILPEIGGIRYRRLPVEGSWNSRFITDYLSLPIHFTYYADWRHRKGFHAGVSLLPGMAVATGKLIRHFDAYGGVEEDSYNPTTGDTTWGHVRYDIHDVQEVKLNPKLDLRITLGWANWSVFLQMSTIPLLHNEAALELYPMKLGARIKL